ncbi:class I SAM-dependent methyltransferase [Pleurocapsales cyanobacterium LEGE 06147]|nr:class I SAM-dependent methyltransferase [Pleurocapsales cyanobacterium LEGE 06147]
MEWTIGWWQISIQRVWPTKERLTQIYDRAAPRWHRHLHLFGYDRAYTKLFQSLQQSGVLAYLKDDSTVCDCGIGTAGFSLALAKTVTPKLNIIGVDISPEMLGKASRILSVAGVKHQVCQGDAIALPFEDNTFDLVMSAHMLEHLPNPNAGLSEMVRVLRSGTPLLLAVTRPGLVGSLIQFYWGNGCLKPESLTQMMADAGLTNICIYPFTHGFSRWTSIACLGFKK